jgi:hypothetical protein
LDLSESYCIVHSLCCLSKNISAIT